MESFFNVSNFIIFINYNSLEKNVYKSIVELE